MKLKLISKKAFTLLELIIVIIIVGILATLGLSTYTNQVEYGRTAEARARIGAMRKLANEYYLKNGTLDGITNSDVGVDFTCTSASYFQYIVNINGYGYHSLGGYRCTSGGKSPDAQRGYWYYYTIEPGHETGTFCCHYTGDSTGCFGLPFCG